MVANDFSQSMVPRYFSLQDKESARLVRNLIKDPSKFISEVNLRIGIIILRVTYGYYVESADDPFLTTPLLAMANFGKATQPGNFLVDFVPACTS
ncbi:Cytochrome P450 monooxygenase 45 [Psilocybe cubensis]|uniref:Cytochrome P450 monooxygenase 45 n=1 Tax=Psilocybe cubensis TaxID=181762 RepID=A0ACB8GL88_PSICU|nr:Cytochrome P450 monooxygenase 45 [Psilocybe cubensis]KAH9475790.1 Cytochrome P450 monooxygenase 45 [Psilocybe cubensis]